MARIKIKKKKETVKKTSGVEKYRDNQVKSDFIHFIARKVYFKGLIRGGTANPNMKPASIDKNCAIYKSVVRDALSILIEEGFLNLSGLEIPEGQLEKAQDE